MSAQNESVVSELDLTADFKALKPQVFELVRRPNTVREEFDGRQLYVSTRIC